MNCLRLFRFAERQTSNIFRITSAKSISGQHVKYTETQNKWRERDGMSKDWEMIYKGPMENALKIASTYLTVSSAAIAGCGLYYGIFLLEPSEWDKPVLLGQDVVIANNALECFTYIGAFVAFHIAVKMLLSKLVCRLYQNGDDYVAVFRGHFYNSIQKHHFNLKQFKKLRPTLVVTWGDARFGLGKKHAILLEHYFKTPEHFNYLLRAGLTEYSDNY